MFVSNHLQRHQVQSHQTQVQTTEQTREAHQNGGEQQTEGDDVPGLRRLLGLHQLADVLHDGGSGHAGATLHRAVSVVLGSALQVGNCYGGLRVLRNRRLRSKVMNLLTRGNMASVRLQQAPKSARHRGSHGNAGRHTIGLDVANNHNGSICLFNRLGRLLGSLNRKGGGNSLSVFTVAVDVVRGIFLQIRNRIEEGSVRLNSLKRGEISLRRNRRGRFHSKASHLSVLVQSHLHFDLFHARVNRVNCKRRCF